MSGPDSYAQHMKGAKHKRVSNTGVYLNTPTYIETSALVPECQSRKLYHR